MKKIAMTIAASAFLATGLIAQDSPAGDLDDRKEVREAVGAEAGDRVGRRSEARENVEADAGDRKEVREAADVEAGDRVEARGDLRERR